MKMIYYNPSQKINIVYEKEKTYIKSTIDVLVKAGEKLTRVDLPSTANLVKYKIETDSGNATDYNNHFDEEVKTDPQTIAVVNWIVARLASGQSTKLPKPHKVKVTVNIHRHDNSVAGKKDTTKTINDDADIDIR